MDINELFGGFALAAVFAAVLLQQLGAPIPAGPVLVLAGASAVAQPLQGLYALALAVAASGLGTLPWFYAGRRYGYRALRLVCRVGFSADACLRKTESAFARYGAASLVAAKFIPGFFRLAPPLAGALRVGLAPFLAYSGAGAALWAGGALLLGFLFHGEIDWMLGRLGEVGGIGATVLASAVAGYVAFRLVRRWRFSRALRAAETHAK